MFELPLIRLDKLEYLQKMQAGELYMRNSFYYQTLEQIDIARSDPYDGSLPTDGVIKMPAFGSKESQIQNPRIVMGDTFIKCFFYYSEQECTKTSSGEYLLLLSEDSKTELSSFNQDFALVIVSPNRFIEQVERACLQNQSKLWYSSIDYIDREEMTKLTEEFVKALQSEKELINPSFYKDKRFSKQQEFRICARHPYRSISAPLIDRGLEYFKIAPTVVDEVFSIDIGSIESISFIIPFARLIDQTIIIKANENSIRLSSEVC